MQIVNLIPQLYTKAEALANKAGLNLMAHENLPEEKLSFPYECNGYAADSHYLQALEKQIELVKKFFADRNILVDPNTPVMGLTYNQLKDMITQVKECLTNPANVISSSGSEPNIGLYIATGIGVLAVGMGVAWYLKSRSKSSETGPL